MPVPDELIVSWFEQESVPVFQSNPYLCWDFHPSITIKRLGCNPDWRHGILVLKLPLKVTFR